MNIVDSSAWLEYVTDGPNASFFSTAIEDTAQLVVPTVCLLEVQRVILRQASEGAWLDVALVMKQGMLVSLDEEVALLAGRVGVVHKLPLADSIVYATALRVTGTVWTQDADFEGLQHVKYRKKHAI